MTGPRVPAGRYRGCPAGRRVGRSRWTSRARRSRSGAHVLRRRPVRRRDRLARRAGHQHRSRRPERGCRRDADRRVGSQGDGYEENEFAYAGFDGGDREDVYGRAEERGEFGSKPGHGDGADVVVEVDEEIDISVLSVPGAGDTEEYLHDRDGPRIKRTT